MHCCLLEATVCESCSLHMKGGYISYIVQHHHSTKSQYKSVHACWPVAFRSVLCLSKKCLLVDVHAAVGPEMSYGGAINEHDLDWRTTSIFANYTIQRNHCAFKNT